jgi:hypothetical protein
MIIVILLSIGIGDEAREMFIENYVNTSTDFFCIEFALFSTQMHFESMCNQKNI